MNADPLARFTWDHAEVLRLLGRLEHAGEALRGGAEPVHHVETAAEVLDVLRSRVRRHNEEEERALFPELGGEAPVGPFHEDHETLRRLEDTLDRAIRTFDVELISVTALDIASLLRAHIVREEEVLFPMARGLLGEDGLARVARRLADLPPDS